MLKIEKLKNSTLLFFGLFLIGFGIFLGFYEYFEAKKDSTFSKMNVLLYESETPKEIDSDEEIIIEQNKEQEKVISDEPKNPDSIISQQIKYDFVGILEIPKINLKRGFLDLNSKYNKVNYNITVINGSTYPKNENNNLILASHSGNCSVCFFNKLYKLSIDDEAYIYYNNIKYIYKIVNIYEVEKTGKVAIYRNPSISTLTLITCTRNSNTKQTVYILELNSKKNY